MQVTKESLAARIAELEAGPRSIKEDFQLEAYSMLRDVLSRNVIGHTTERASFCLSHSLAI